MTLHIGQEVGVPCPECGPDNHLVVQINRYGRLFLGCPNYADTPPCQYTRSIPVDIQMAAAGQPTLFSLEALDD